MIKGIGTAVLGVVLFLGTPVAGLAQAPETWVSGWGGLFMDPGTVRDDQSDRLWDLGTSFTVGTSVQRLFGQSLLAGLDLAYAPIRYELKDPATREPVEGESGRGHLVTTMVTGRLGAGGGGDFFTYLTGGIGAVTYGIPTLDRWDPDFAFRAGGGIEYRHSRAVALFVEWNRWWVLHQTGGVDDNTVRNANVEFGARYGF